MTKNYFLKGLQIEIVSCKPHLKEELLIDLISLRLKKL